MLERGDFDIEGKIKVQDRRRGLYINNVCCCSEFTREKEH
jgi:hypothetical protein